MTMFKKTKAKTVQEYIESVPEEKKEDFLFLHQLIKKTIPEAKVHFASNMIGYGSFKYSNYKKDIIDWPTVALAAQKNYFSIYICSLENGEYLAEKYQSDLGKVNCGKSCIRIKKIDDLNISTLKKILRKAHKNPGLRA